ncbi:MAG: flagellar basal body rod protein FlgC [Planctomycetota bacterium]|nr:flagellar basal body rod protein FlgC [Planctomycetota bacterium]
MYGALEISTSGMIAQRTRINVIAANIANASTVMDSEGNAMPYQRRIALFSEGASSGRPGDRSLGVRVQQIALDDAPFRQVYDPSHPLAAKETDESRGLVEGYVRYPNVDTTVETINSIEAARAYEANVAAAEATKSMLAQALRLIA